MTSSAIAPGGADMRALLPPVRDQGQRGTCVAFAVTAAHEVARSAGITVTEDLSEEALFWGCKLIDGNWTSGTSFDSAASALGATGQPLEGIWPYNPRRAAGIRYDPPCRPSTDWHKSRLERTSSALVSVRSEIDAGHPVVLGLTVFDTLYIPAPAGRIDPPAAGSPARGRHAVLAVGHDADALLIRNSWGPTWALGGYGWLTSEYAEHHIRQAWAIQPRLRGPASSSEVRSRETCMNLTEYQQQAQVTDQLPSGDPNAVIVPLLGMAGEVGSLLAEYKKYLRDKDAHVLFPNQVAEELGDILWYLANTATKFDLDLATIAVGNLAKTRDRWPPVGHADQYRLFDDEFPATEQLPRSFSAEIVDKVGAAGKGRITLTIDGVPAGDPLQDNAYDEDGYRFHDVFHLAHAAKLGWSPVLRGKLLTPSRKRRSAPDVDEVEDGGRAVVIDEAIVAYVWEYARRHRFLDGVTAVDYPVLKTIRQLTGGLEVAARTAHDWEEAILAGYRVFRKIRARRGGVIAIDLRARSIDVVQ